MVNSGEIAIRVDQTMDQLLEERQKQKTMNQGKGKSLVNRRELSDDTKLGGTPWRSLKKFAMKPNHTNQGLFVSNSNIH